MLCVFVCAPVHVHGQSDTCWAAIVIDLNVYWAALPTGLLCLLGCSVYWWVQDAIVECGRHGMVDSVTKVRRAWKNEWAQKCNGGMASRFTRIYGIFLCMRM